MAAGLSFEVEGFDKIAKAIRQLGDDKIKARKVRTILKHQSKPALRALNRNTPDRSKSSDGNKSQRAIKRGGSLYWPGNLKRSNEIKTRGKDYPTAFIGANVPSKRAKKKSGSGYYGYFIQYGLSTHRGNPDNYVLRAKEQAEAEVGDGVSAELARYIKREAKKLGFVTT